MTGTGPTADATTRTRTRLAISEATDSLTNTDDRVYNWTTDNGLPVALFTRLSESEVSTVTEYAFKHNIDVHEWSPTAVLLTPKHVEVQRVPAEVQALGLRPA